MLVLASKSPRRQELLRQMGLEFEVCPCDIDERPAEGVAPEILVQELAVLKAACVAKKARAGSIIIAADTVVAVDDTILCKPKGARDAHAMLSLLSGRAHYVYTGVCCLNNQTTYMAARTQRTTVRFKNLTDTEITQYIETGEPFDKAGAYGIQGLGGMLTEGIEGDYHNVVGLPISLLYELLKTEFDYDVLGRRE